MLGTDVIYNALGYLFCLCTLLLFVDFCSLFFRRNSLEVSGSTLSVVHAGEQVMLPLRVRAMSKVSNSCLALYPSQPEVSFKAFYEAHEPEESKRNIFDRIMKYYRWMWLHEKRGFEAVESEILELAPHTEREIMMETLFHERGLWELTDARAKLLGVFGLLKRSLKTPGNRNSIHVAPALVSVTWNTGLGMGRSEEASVDTNQQIGESHEFLSLRDYHPGDSWRKVNWKAMARTDKMMVQENEEFSAPRYTLQWNSRGMNEIEFETAASTLASLMIELVRSGDSGQVIISHGGGARVYDWPTAKVEILQLLARIEFQEEWDAEPVEIKGVHYLIAKEAEGEANLLQVQGTTVNGTALKEGLTL